MRVMHRLVPNTRHLPHLPSAPPPTTSPPAHHAHSHPCTGTEDGWIHQCSSSYSSQYLASYAGHLGPVYRLAWSPFKPDLFISASADWTVRLWQQGKRAPLLNFQSGNDEVGLGGWGSQECGGEREEGQECGGEGEGGLWLQFVQAGADVSGGGKKRCCVNQFRRLYVG